jgi:hypothetical protein
MRMPRFKLRSLILLVLIVALGLTVVIQQMQIARLHRQIMVSRQVDIAAREMAAAQRAIAQAERYAALRQLEDAHARKADAQANGGR